MKYLSYFLILVLWPFPAEAQQTGPNRAGLAAPLRAQVEQLERDYGSELILENPGFPILAQDSYVLIGEPASPASLQKYLPQFIEEWRLYPPQLIRKSQLKQIVICDNLKTDGGEIPGFTNAKQRSIVYNFGLDRSWEDEKPRFLFFRARIHHELFHHIDRQIRRDIYSDPSWEALNAPDFRYGRRLLEETSPLVTNRFPGFITTYSQVALPEDKADLFSHMISNLHEMECRCKDDAILEKKTARLKKDLSDFCSDMNDGFWNKVRALNRPRLTLQGYEDPWARDHPTLPTRSPGDAVPRR
jgi:hypothetical protein